MEVCDLQTKRYNVKERRLKERFPSFPKTPIPRRRKAW